MNKDLRTTSKKRIISSAIILLSLCLYWSACQESGNHTQQEIAKEDTSSHPAKLTDFDIDQHIIQTIKVADSLSNRRVKEYDAAFLLLGNLRNHSAYAQATSDSKGTIYHKLAVIKYRAKAYEATFPYLDTAIAIRQQLPQNAKPRLQLANSYFIRGLGATKINRYEEALPDFENAIAIAELYPDSIAKRKFSQYISHAAVSARELGDIGKAIQYYDAALDLTEKVYGTQSSAMAGIYNSLGNLYMNQSDTVKALDNLYKSLAIRQEMADDNKVADVNNNLASAHIQFGQYEIAIHRLQELIAYYDANKFDLEKADMMNRKAKGLNNLAYAQFKLQEYKQAKKSYQEILKIADQLQESAHSINRTHAYEGLGDVAAAQGNFDLALQHYQTATESLCLKYRAQAPLDLPKLSEDIVLDKNSLKRILALKADALNKAFHSKQQTNYLQAAFQTYQCIDSLIIQIRSGFKSDLSRFDIVEGTLPIYEKATKVALRLYELSSEPSYLQAGLDFSSKNKAIVLVEGLQGSKALSLGIPAELLTEEQQLKQQFYDLETLIFDLEEGEAPQEKIDSVKQERFAVTRAREKLIAEFEANYPAYHSLKYSLDQKLDIQQLQANLPPQSAMIEYFVGFDSLYIFSLSARGLQAYQSAKPKHFDQLCSDFRLASSNKSPLSQFIPLSRQLYQILLQEALADLSGQEISRLFLIPDDLLLDISFDALLYEDLNEQQLKDDWAASQMPFLLRRYAINYAYSNRLLFAPQNQATKTTAEHSFAGFGLNYEHYRQLPPTILANRDLGVLQSAVKEVESIADQLDGQVWTNAQATRATFIEQAPKYQILHLAMHGVVDKKFPLKSALIFSPNAEGKDSLLAAKDLYSMSLNADLAVLSACDTGTGQLQKGEGAMSLARAFNYAGCPSLVASLWKAGDASTKDLMLRFYQNLQAGNPKDVALQKAKLAYLDANAQTYVYPKTWTHLTQIGDPKALDLAQAGLGAFLSSKWWILGGAFILALLVFGQRWFRAA